MKTMHDFVILTLGTVTIHLEEVSCNIVQLAQLLLLAILPVVIFISEIGVIM
jgi:hypothetical protein